MAESVSARRDRVISFIWVVAFVGAGAFFSVLLTQTVKDRQRHEVKRVRVEKMCEETKSRVERLKLEQEAIVSDPIYVEGVARDSLRYAKPGEVTYQRENVPLQRVQGREKADNSSPLAALLDTKLRQWQVPITVLAVVIIALLIVHGFGPRGEGANPEGAP